MGKRSKSSIRIAVTIFAVMIFLITASIMLFTPNSSEIMVPGNVAMVVDGEKISVGFYNYFYSAATGPETIKQMEAMYDDFSIDSTESSGKKWLDYFSRSTEEQLKSIIILSHKAEDAGLVLIEEQTELVNQQIEYVKAKAEEYDVTSNGYASAQYGKKVGIKTLKKILEKSFLVQNYYEYLCVNSELDDEQFSEYFKNNAENLYMASFDYFVMKYSDENYEEKVSEAYSIIEKSDSPDTFESSIQKAFPEKDFWGFYANETQKYDRVYKKDVLDFPEKVISWIYGQRKPNEVGLIDNSESKEIYLVYIKAPAVQATKVTCSVREIFIPFDETEDSKEEALKIRNGIADRVSSADNPEYLFAVLADVYSKDGEPTKHSGGLVTDIFDGDSNEKMNNWLFDESRKKGDCLMLDGNAGFYIFLFSDKEESWRTEAMLDNVSCLLKKAEESVKTKRAFAYREVMNEPKAIY